LLKELYAKFHDRGLVIVSISIDDEREKFESVATKAALPWAQVFEGRGTKGEFVKLFNARAIPVSFLIDAEGRIAARIVAAAQLSDQISKLMPAQAPASPSAEEEKREQAIKLPEILEALAISIGSQVADIGAGGGFFTSRLAKKVAPAGRVFAVDIDDKYAIPKLKELVEKQSLTNVSVILSQPADPKLPMGSLDAALFVNAYHEVEPYREMLSHIMQSLKPGGRMVVVDNMPQKTRSRPRSDQTKNHVLAPEVAEPELIAAGFEIVARRDDFVDRPDEEDAKWMIVCRRPIK